MQIFNSKILFFALILATTFSCGKNVFKDLEKKDPALEATSAMEAGDNEEAIRIILNALGSEMESAYINLTDESYDLATAKGELLSAVEASVTQEGEEAINLISILSSAKAASHGVDPFKMALKLIENASESSSNSSLASNTTGNNNNISMLFPVLPEASIDNINGMQVASLVLESLGSHQRLAETYKSALFLTASLALSSKALDLDGDGVISPSEALSMSPSSAQAILSQISSAAGAAAATYGVEDQAQNVSSEQIMAIQTAINASEGATPEEKLKNYIASQGASNNNGGNHVNP